MWPEDHKYSSYFERTMDKYKDYKIILKKEDIYNTWPTAGHTDNSDVVDSLSTVIMSKPINSGTSTVSNVDIKYELLNNELKKKDLRILELENEIQMMKDILGINDNDL